MRSLNQSVRFNRRLSQSMKKKRQPDMTKETQIFLLSLVAHQLEMMQTSVLEDESLMKALSKERLLQAKDELMNEIVCE